jgi:hypothetical protein
LNETILSISKCGFSGKGANMNAPWQKFGFWDEITILTDAGAKSYRNRRQVCKMRTPTDRFIGKLPRQMRRGEHG